MFGAIGLRFLRLSPSSWQGVLLGLDMVLGRKPLEPSRVAQPNIWMDAAVKLGASRPHKAALSIERSWGGPGFGIPALEAAFKKSCIPQKKGGGWTWSVFLVNDASGFNRSLRKKQFFVALLGAPVHSELRVSGNGEGPYLTKYRAMTCSRPLLAVPRGWAFFIDGALQQGNIRPDLHSNLSHRCDA